MAVAEGTRGQRRARTAAIRSEYKEKIRNLSTHVEEDSAA